MLLDLILDKKQGLYRQVHYSAWHYDIAEYNELEKKVCEVLNQSLFHSKAKEAAK